MADFLRDLEHRMNVFNGKHEIPLCELFSSTFMRENTPFSNFSSFLKAGGFHEEEFDEIPDEKLDAYVAKKTRFRNFEEMQEIAMQEYALKQLGF